jgi:hypothetical protein
MPPSLRALEEGPAPVTDDGRAAARLGYWAGNVVLVGLLLSGPCGVLAAGALAPQPPWTGAAAFMAHYHSIQSIPFLCGFLLVLGFPALHLAIAMRSRRPASILALIYATVFASLISFNYLAQGVVVPGAARGLEAGAGVVITLLSMANPASVCWPIEMIGYGFLGLASLFAAPAFKDGSRWDRAAAGLLVANGVTSLLGAGLEAVDTSWVLTPAGLAGYIVWNLIVMAMVVALTASFRQRLRAP